MGIFYLDIIKRACGKVYEKLGKFTTFLAILGIFASPIIEEIGKWFSNSLGKYPGWVISSIILIGFFIWVGYCAIQIIFEDQENLKEEFGNLKKFYEPKIEICFENNPPYIQEEKASGWKNQTLYRIGIKNTSNQTIIGLKTQLVGITPTILFYNSILPLNLIQMNTIQPYPTEFSINPEEEPKFIDVLKIRNHSSNQSDLHITCTAPTEDYRCKLEPENYEIKISITGQNISGKTKIFSLICNQENNFVFMEAE